MSSTTAPHSGQAKNIALLSPALPPIIVGRNHSPFAS